MRKIKLSQGKFALVDDADFDWLSKWKWYAAKGRNTWYAGRNVRIPGSKRRTSLRMHRFILGITTTLACGDHINGNGLDNCRSNIRRATHAQNSRNQKIRTNGASKFKGVARNKLANKWIAQIKFEYKNIGLGYFKSEIKAARAYNKKAKELFGEFAKLNAA